MRFLNVSFFTIFSIILIGCCYAQDNAQTRVASALEECYRNPEVIIRDNRLPMTMNLLIELIRKIEDTPGYNTDLRQLSADLLHRFRQDGIKREPGVELTASVLPYSPSGYQYYKNRILLTKLVQGNANNFPNDTLTLIERCSLHFMLSSSFELGVRGDENVRCGQLAQYRLRGPRDLKNQMRYQRSVNENELQNNRNRRAARMQFVEGEDETKKTEGDPSVEGAMGRDDDETYIVNNVNFDVINTKDSTDNNARSQCPVESGVVRTTWGSISAGALIAGIAAGLQPQIVKTTNLIDPKSKGTLSGSQSMGVDNRFAATLAGDLAEISLLQGPLHNEIQIGAAGAWNSTSVPKWYFLSKNKNLEMTDAEIRGGLDGLILANGIQDWRNKAPSLKLSQLLEMYYSTRGVFTRTTRACNRNGLFTTVAPIAQLKAQTVAFSVILDREMQLKVSVSQEGIAAFASKSADALSEYIPRLTDLPCGVSSSSSNEEVESQIATDILIFTDFTWTYREIQPIIANLLENINVKRIGSSYTLLSANDASTIVDKVSNSSSFYLKWNSTYHSTVAPGLNLPNILKHLREKSIELLEGERRNSSVGGRSHIALIITNNADVSEADKGFAIQQIQILREESPDLRIMFFAGGVPARFAPFVVDDAKDIFTLIPSTGISDTKADNVKPVIERIQTVPRRVINYRCGSNFEQSDKGNSQLTAHVDPNSIVYYRVHPNYFYRSDGDRKIKIQGSGFGSISVCSSRTNPNPRMNASNTAGDSTCRLINSDTFEIDLSKPCDDYNYIRDCPPVYFSVEGIASEGADFRCMDDTCPFPDSLRFAINTESLGCYSGVGQLLSTLTLIILASLFVLLRV